ncbi:LysR family transcriptional regulator [Endozoicomonas sp.]|uniref:LysR family transcriptional regulator n=1 Tax=Endozoicomonas sp. TaxID=1892382 RepID=UPI00383B3EB9
MINLQDYNLNLLLIFDAVMRTGSISGAAVQLDMTTAAVSKAMTKLRQKTPDPLFIRDGRGIRPTNHAIIMHQHIKEGLRSFEQGLGSGIEFNPATSDRNFVIAGEVYLDDLLYPNLLTHCQQHAPSITTRLIPTTDRTDEAYAALSERRADLFIGTAVISHSSIKQEWLKSFEIAVVCARDHPRIQKTLTREQYFSEKHICLGLQKLDERMARLSDTPLPQRDIAYYSHSPLSMLIAASRTELLCTTHRRLALEWCDKLDLQILELPFPLRPAPHYMSWHISKSSDPGLNWLRQQLKQLMGTVG